MAGPPQYLLSASSVIVGWSATPSCRQTTYHTVQPVAFVSASCLRGGCRGGKRIEPFNRCANPLAAFRRGKIRLPLDCFGLRGQALVLELLAKPARDIALAKVEAPSRLIHALGKLQEEEQVL